MVEISIAAAITFCIVIQLQVIFEREVNLRSAITAFAYLLFLTTIACANWELEFFEQKFAAQFAYDVYKGQESLRANTTFILQAIIGAPAFLLTDVWWAAIGTNIAIAAGIFYFVHKRSPILSLILLAPAVVNFSMFSLRDPVIAANAFLITMLFLSPPQTWANLKQGSAVALFALIRPENMIIFAYAKLMTIFQENSRTFLIYLCIPIFLAATVAVTSFAPQLVGIENKSVQDLPNAATDFYESRATRWETDEGGGSNILGGALPAMPIYIRYPIQVFTFFVMPLPFEIKKLALALCFLDSIVFCAMAYRCHRTSSAKALIIFWVYVLIVAFFSNNYGNVFRLRLPAYFILLAGLVAREPTEPDYD